MENDTTPSFVIIHLFTIPLFETHVCYTTNIQDTWTYFEQFYWNSDFESSCRHLPTSPVKEVRIQTNTTICDAWFDLIISSLQFSNENYTAA
jgi:hypothetical protein